MKTLNTIIITGLTVLMLSSCATRQMNMGHEAYDHLAYSEAIEYYKEVPDDKKDYTTMQRLARSYHLINQSEKAVEWYRKALQVKPDTDTSDIYLNYAQALEATNRYDLAHFYYNEYFMDHPEDFATFKRMRSTEQNSKGVYLNEKYAVNKLLINQTYRSNLSPVYYKDGIVFTSERNTEDNNETSPWTGRPFVDMYYANLKSDFKMEEPELFAPNLQTPFDDGAVSFSPDGKTMYFTRTNFINGELAFDDKNVVNLKILKSEFKNGQWQDPEQLLFNSDHFNCIHPAVSPDGKKLYFSSDRPGGYGESDIYVVDISADGSTSLPKNLGPVVNTERRELFPTAFDDNGTLTLYFSSEGHPGYGGLDVYRTMGDDTLWGMPEILPMPINSSKDDYGMMFNKNMTEGFITSNRDSKEGIDAIFNFERTVLDDAVAEFKGECNDDLDIKIKELSSDIGVEPLEMEGNLIDISDYSIEPIYYEFDKAEITDSAKEQLSKIANIMEAHPLLEVDLEGHADSRGSEPYNKDLSMRRAKAARDYLMSLGVDESRINLNWEGETELVNDCDQKVDDCTEEQHQRNRRTEIQSLKLNLLSMTTKSEDE